MCEESYRDDRKSWKENNIYYEFYNRKNQYRLVKIVRSEDFYKNWKNKIPERIIKTKKISENFNWEKCPYFGFFQYFYCNDKSCLQIEFCQIAKPCIKEIDPDETEWVIDACFGYNILYSVYMTKAKKFGHRYSLKKIKFR